MKKTATALERHAGERASQIVEAPSCWTSGMVQKGDGLEGVGTTFYNPDGPLILGALRCKQLSFSVTFSDAKLERAAIAEMRAKSTGDTYGGQHYEVQFEGIVEGNGTDGSNLRVKKFKILRPVTNDLAFSPNA